VVMKTADVSAAPPELRRLLAACLQKDPRKRLRDIGDVWHLLDEGRAPTAVAEGGRARAGRPWLWPAVAGVLAVLAGVALWAPWQTMQPAHLKRLSIDLPGAMDLSPFADVALSPDGTRIVWSRAGAGGVPVLATRLLSEKDGRLLPGTEGGIQPFFSPDGQWIGFLDIERGQLEKVSVRGGVPITLAPAVAAHGASWGTDGFIVAALNVAAPLVRIPEAGNAPPEEAVSPAEVNGSGLEFPQHLPGGRAMLFAAGGATRGLYAKDFATGEVREVVPGAVHGRYLPTGRGTGHLVYASDGGLFAFPFDPVRLSRLGPTQPVLDDVAGDMTFSASGAFVYRIGDPGERRWPVWWMDSSGATQPLLEMPGTYHSPVFSPDGNRLALVRGLPPERGEVLVYHWQNDRPPLHLTPSGTSHVQPVWTPDGRHLAVFAPPASIEWIRADGSGEPRRLGTFQHDMIPTSIARDGRHILLSEANPRTQLDLWFAPLDLTDSDAPVVGEPQLILDNPGNDFGAVFSPDGKWIAYLSDESGRYEIWVRPFPGPGRATRVSVNGGVYPSWSDKGDQLFFAWHDGIHVADFEVRGEALVPLRVRPWRQAPMRSVETARSYALHPDGDRIAMFPPERADPEAGGGPRFAYLLNFFDELRRVAPPAGR
jgi:hypothetical protein